MEGGNREPMQLKHIDEKKGPHLRHHHVCESQEGEGTHGGQLQAQGHKEHGRGEARRSTRCASASKCSHAVTAACNALSILFYLLKHRQSSMQTLTLAPAAARPLPPLAVGLSLLLPGLGMTGLLPPLPAVSIGAMPPALAAAVAPACAACVALGDWKAAAAWVAPEGPLWSPPLDPAPACSGVPHGCKGRETGKGNKEKQIKGR
jgi:hypothetical protein